MIDGKQRVVVVVVVVVVVDVKEFYRRFIPDSSRYSF